MPSHPRSPGGPPPGDQGPPRPASKRPFPLHPDRVRHSFRRLGETWRAPEQRTANRALIIGALGVVALLIGYTSYILFRLPTVERQAVEDTVAQASIVLAADGSEITRYHLQNRTWVGLEAIAPHVVEALVATEDHRFYGHGGIDLFRTLSSTFKTVGGDQQGGSTITQQLARNAFSEVGRRTSVSRKFREMLTALQLEARYSKEEILELYLNTVSFNHNAFGIEAASLTYFNKSAVDLSLAEGATLIGMLKATTYYNPVRHPERSVQRRNTVLDQMIKHARTDTGAAEQAKRAPLELDFRPPSPENNTAPHFTEYVRKWLKEWGEENGYDIYTDGLVIHTTLRPDLQALAQEAVAEQMGGLQAVADVEWSRSNPPFYSSLSSYVSYRQNVRPFDYFWNTRPETVNGFIKSTERYRSLTSEGMSESEALETLRNDAAYADSLRAVATRLETGLVAIDPTTRHVVAWVGGKNFEEDQYDHVALAQRQPGSTFKPFVYAAAIEDGYSPYHQLLDEEVEIRLSGSQTWRPRNAGGSVTGQPMTLYDGLAYSKNTITAQLINLVGPRAVAQLARRAGIQSELNAVPSLALGTSEVNLLELTNAYTTLAAQGRYAPPVFVTRIENSNGRVLARFESSSRQVLTATTAYTVVDMMRNVVDRGTGVRIRNVFGVRGDAGGKTGTTQNSADGWFMLVKPDLVTGAWVGFNNRAITFRSNYWGQGGHNALYVMGDFLRRAQRDGALSDARFQPPPGYVEPQPPAQPDTLFQYADYYEDYEDIGRDIDSLLARDTYRDSLLLSRMDDRQVRREADAARRDSVAQNRAATRGTDTQGRGNNAQNGNNAERANETQAERIKRLQAEIKEKNRQDEARRGTGQSGRRDSTTRARRDSSGTG